ncbi:hypothetical protein B0H14DRAFT_2590657 [Mycena olivaceomarginata]|nr:hypothetical protein B0H14DRAFT_2590657 [Mycena olivaceomarginata]
MWPIFQDNWAQGKSCASVVVHLLLSQTPTEELRKIPTRVMESGPGVVGPQSHAAPSPGVLLPLSRRVLRHTKDFEVPVNLNGRGTESLGLPHPAIRAHATPVPFPQS